MISSFWIFLILTGFLWGLASLVLALHRGQTQTGLTPLMMLLGGFAVAIQFQGLGAVHIPSGYTSLYLEGLILLPNLLLGVLVVYIANGTVRGRSAALGVLLISGITIIFQVALAYLNQVGTADYTPFLQSAPLRIRVAGTVTLAMDLIVLFLTYQSISNLRRRYPGYLAGGIALLAALIVDAIIFPIIAYRGSIDWLAVLESQLLGKVLAGLLLWPGLSFYLYRVAPALPDSLAASPRPVLDLFSTTLQLERRARYHYDLLHTLSQINQLIVQSTDTQTFLQQTCEALVELRKYHMVWIGTLDEKSGELNFAAQAGFTPQQVGEYVQSGEIAHHHHIGTHEQPEIIPNINVQKEYDPSWRKMMLASGCRDAARFPMRSADKILGTLYICTDQPNSLGQTEIDLLQELADDLAYALVNLEGRKQQDILQTAAEHMRDGLVIADLDGKVLYVNSVVAYITGKTQQEMLGEQIKSLASPELDADLPALLKRIKQGKDITLEFNFRTPDQQKMDAIAHASLVKNHLGQPQYIVVSIRNNTQWRKYESQLLAINHLTGELVQIYDSQTLMETVLHTSEDLLDADASGIYLVDLETQKIIDTLTHNVPREYSQRIVRDYRGLPGDMARQTMQPAFVEDTLQDEVYAERVHFIAEHGIRALIVLPVVFQGQLLGALTLYYAQPHEFTNNQLQIGNTLVQTLAIVIQNARLYRAEQEQRKLAQAQAQAAASLTSSLDLEDVLDRILEQVMQVIPCQAANIQMLRDDHAYIRRHRGYEEHPEYIETLASVKFPLSTPNIQQMFTSDEAILIPDTRKDPDWVIISGAEWVQGYAGIPLKTDGKIVGFLNVDSDEAGFFNEATISRLQIFANHAATAIRNARLYHAEHNQRELAEALAQAAASVSSSLELDEVLDRILEQTMRVIPCQAVNIMTIDGDKTFITRHRGYENYLDDTSRILDLQPDVSWPILQELYQEEIPVLIADTALDPRWTQLSETSWVRSYIGIPLKVNQQIVGFLNLDSDQPNYLSETQFQRLQTFANYASTAIKNARAYEGSRRRAEEMAALVAAASAVSRNLDFMQVLRVVSKQMTKTLRIQACAISTYDPEQNTLTYLIGHGPEGWDIDKKWSQLNSLEKYPVTLSILQNNIPHQIQIENPDLNPIQRQFMEDAQANTLLLLPLITQDRTIGLVVLMDDARDRIFTVREIALGLSVASHAATAIENARLYQQLQEHASDLEERVLARTQELQEATDYIEGILASVPDAIFVLDPNHQLVQANQSGQILLSQAQTTGLDLFNPQLLEILETGGGPNMQSILEVQERAYQALSSQLVAEDGSASGQIIVFRDVTAFRELDQMKTQFVSDVSHELRTPLTNLTLYLGLLTAVQDTNKQNEYIQTLQRETERLTHLIEDLLTISRLEASRIQFQIRAIDLNQLAENLVRDRAILAAQKGIHLNFTPAPNLRLAAADANMLTQAISNLLTNAINYTLPDGNIHITTAQPNPEAVTIQIRDTGVGIHPDELERVFDRFYRGSASQETGAEGTGLGLAIAQEIIQRLDGKITLETAPGEGSTFTIWLNPASSELL